MRQKIGVIGGGWFGGHAAKTYAEMGYQVVMYDKNSKCFNEISGHNGRRLNSGAHYLTSELTRDGCKRGSSLFKEQYPELLVDNYSLYGYTERDYDNKPSKVSKEHFLKVCEEYNNDEYLCEKVDPKKLGYENLSAAVKIKEPSIISGEQLSERFKGYLENAGVTIKYNFEVTKLEKQPNNKILVGNNEETDEFDHVINATAFMSLLPSLSDLPKGMEIVYQVCLALIYKNKEENKVPFDKFTVMDGFNPCYLPRNKNNEYILTHAKLTNSSYSTPSEAKEKLNSYKTDGEYIEYVKHECEKEINKYYPAFNASFEYLGWDGVVIPKMKTTTEFRSAVTFRDLITGVIHVFPGKISDVFFIVSEILSLINNENVIKDGNYEYAKDGTLDKGTREIKQKPEGDALERSTCGLQTSQEWEAKKKTNENKVTQSDSANKVTNRSQNFCSKRKKRKKQSELNSLLFKKMKYNPTIENFTYDSIQLQP